MVLFMNQSSTEFDRKAQTNIITKNIDHPAPHVKLQIPEKKLQLGPLLQLVLPLNELLTYFCLLADCSTRHTHRALEVLIQGIDSEITLFVWLKTNHCGRCIL